MSKQASNVSETAEEENTCYEIKREYRCIVLHVYRVFHNM